MVVKLATFVFTMACPVGLTWVARIDRLVPGKPDCGRQRACLSRRSGSQS